MKKSNDKNFLKYIGSLFTIVARKLRYELREFFKLYESDSKLATDSHNYWNRDYSDSNLAQDAHWKNKGKFEDLQRWQSIGKEHLELIVKQSSALNLQFPVKQVVEWGCGGGANAVHFAPLTEKFIGIDITAESLEECRKQISGLGLNNFHQVLINALSPESILNENIKEADLFICTYVYELFPTPEYGLNVLKLANEILSNNGIAFIQIKYNDGNRRLRSKRWGYNLHPYSMTTYSLVEFWESSKKVGFEPIGMYLEPFQPLVDDCNYAYYFLKKNIDRVK